MNLPSSSRQRIHVVSLQVPFPPDYGGVIDIYYKLKALKDAGYEIWLHTFQYRRDQAEELKEITAKFFTIHVTDLQFSSYPYFHTSFPVDGAQNFSMIYFSMMHLYCSKGCIVVHFFLTNGCKTGSN